MSKRISIIAIIGGVVAALSFYFFPLLEIKPNRLASGVSINLFEIPGNIRLFILPFLLSLAAIPAAFIPQARYRGWVLVIFGNLIVVLTLLLPTDAALQLLAMATTLFEEGTRISNPRVLTSGALALGLFGGYIVLFAGLRDLLEEGVNFWLRTLASSVGLLVIILFLINGEFDIYSVMVEFEARGETLGQRFIEHFVFVVVSLSAGLVIGIALGLWAARDQRMEDGILYTVGIIQTIPSLALFGVLLVPLANLGDQLYLQVAWLTLLLFVLGFVLFYGAIQTRFERTWYWAIAFIAGLVVLEGGHRLFEGLLASGTLSAPGNALTAVFNVLAGETALFFFRVFYVLAAGFAALSLTREEVRQRARIWSLIASFIYLFIPLSLLAIFIVTVGFETVLSIFLAPELRRFLPIVPIGLAGFFFLLWLDRLVDEANDIAALRYARYALLAITGLGTLILIGFGLREALPAGEALNQLTIRDFGVSGIGTAPAVIALTLYSLLPLVRNTYTGLRNVDPAIIDSARGMGMTPTQIFFQIELPLALPIIMAGIRNAGIALVGITAVASIIGAGALGDFILLGVNSTSIDLILLGAIPAVILAVFLDGLLQLIEGLITSPGIKREAA